MIRIFLTGAVFLTLPVSTANTPTFLSRNLEVCEEKTTEVEKIVDTSSAFIQALIQVESTNNDSAVGDNGRAVGPLQIWPITVREVNRILSLKGSSKRYTLSDRWSRTKSIQMFDIWRNHHLPEAPLEVVARTWNGGTKYRFSKDATEYWKKVKYNLDLNLKDPIFREVIRK